MIEGILCQSPALPLRRHGSLRQKQFANAGGLSLTSAQTEPCNLQSGSAHAHASPDVPPKPDNPTDATISPGQAAVPPSADPAPAVPQLTAPEQTASLVDATASTQSGQLSSAQDHRTVRGKVAVKTAAGTAAQAPAVVSDAPMVDAATDVQPLGVDAKPPAAMQATVAYTAAVAVVAQTSDDAADAKADPDAQNVQTAAAGTGPGAAHAQAAGGVTQMAAAAATGALAADVGQAQLGAFTGISPAAATVPPSAPAASSGSAAGSPIAAPPPAVLAATACTPALQAAVVTALPAITIAQGVSQADAANPLIEPNVHLLAAEASTVKSIVDVITVKSPPKVSIALCAKQIVLAVLQCAAM